MPRRTALTAAIAAALLASLTSVAVAHAAPSASAASASASMAGGPCGTASTTDGQAHAIRHVVWVVFETKTRDAVLADPTVAPYLTGLAAECGQATAYQSVPYHAAKLAMTSGTDWGVQGDVATVPGPDLFSQLGTSWTAYLGGMPANCWPTDTDLYYARHNPAAYFTDNQAACASRDLPLPSTPAELDLSQPFTWIEADVPDSMHGCPVLCSATTEGQVAAGDAWASTWISGLVASPQYLEGDTAIFVVWDQGTNATTNANTAFLAISPYTTPGYVSSVPYDHYSLLRGTEDLLGLAPLAHAGDAGTTSVADDFGLPYPAVPGSLPTTPWTGATLAPVILPPPH